MRVVPGFFRFCTLSMGLTLMTLFAAGANGQSQDVDKVPAWYTGTKPWLEIGRAGREDLLRKRAAYEAIIAKAKTPANGTDASGAAAGKKLIASTVAKYGLDPWFLTPDYFGPRMVIWLPETAWARFTSVQRASIENSRG